MLSVNAMEKWKRLAAFARFLPVLPGVPWRDGAFRKDLARWKEICRIDGTDLSAAAQLLWERREFRNLLMYRCRRRRLFRRWLGVLYPPVGTLFLETPVLGGGLYIQHGFSTMIAAASIGENCWISQQVTIGYGKGGTPPVIGNNVAVYCGAKVLGQIRVGDGAVIGANAVVVRDVEEGAVMGGVPARRIR